MKFQPLGILYGEEWEEEEVGVREGEAGRYIKRKP